MCNNYPKIISVSIIHKVETPQKGGGIKKESKRADILVQVDTRLEETKLVNFLLTHEGKRLNASNFPKCPPNCTGNHSFTYVHLNVIKVAKVRDIIGC